LFVSWVELLLPGIGLRLFLVIGDGMATKVSQMFQEKKVCKYLFYIDKIFQNKLTPR